MKQQFEPTNVENQPADVPANGTLTDLHLTEPRAEQIKGGSLGGDGADLLIGGGTGYDSRRGKKVSVPLTVGSPSSF